MTSGGHQVSVSLLTARVMTPAASKRVAHRERVVLLGQLDRSHRAFAANLGQAAVLRDRAEAGEQPLAHHAGPFDQPLLAQKGEVGEPGRAGRRMAGVRVAVAQQPRLVRLQRTAHRRSDQHAAERHVARGDRLGKGREVGLDAEVLGSEPAAEATEAADHFVEDQVATVLVGQSAQSGQVALGRRVDPSGPLDRLGQDGRHLWTVLGQVAGPRFQVVGGEVHHPLHVRSEPFAVERKSLRGHSAIGHAVVGAGTAQDQAALGVAGLHMCDAGQLDGRVDRLRAAAGEEDAALGGRGEAGDQLGQLVGGLVREGLEAGEGGQAAQLGVDGIGDLHPPVADVAVPQAGHPVDEPPAVAIPHLGAGTTGDRDVLIGRPGRTGEGVQKGRGSAHRTGTVARSIVQRAAQNCSNSSKAAFLLAGACSSASSISHSGERPTSRSSSLLSRGPALQDGAVDLRVELHGQRRAEAVRLEPMVVAGQLGGACG